MFIKSNCCAFGFGEEVHVLKKDCPIKREEGQRKYISKGQEIEDCTCVYRDALFGANDIEKCTHYSGIEFDKKGGSYLVNCTSN